VRERIWDARAPKDLHGGSNAFKVVHAGTEDDRLSEARPDYVLILPWNLKTEIMNQLAGIRDWGGSFVVPIPEVTVYP
jgi:hypothetical protein